MTERRVNCYYCYEPAAGGNCAVWAHEAETATERRDFTVSDVAVRRRRPHEPIGLKPQGVLSRRMNL